MIWQPDIVIYHDNCNDGFGAAWAAHQRWPEPGRIFLPASYGDAPPPLNGMTALILDFSYDAETLAALGRECASIVILDHHETARDALAGYQVETQGVDFSWITAHHHIALAKRKSACPIIAHFDMKRSGARLAWDFCHPSKTHPILIDYIEDHDLYTHDLEHSQAVAMAVSSYPKDFEEWTRLSHKRASLIIEGKSILRAWRKAIDDLLCHTILVRIAGETVPALNLPPNMASLGGEMLIEASPKAPFVATWFGRGPRDQWSLRSGGDGMHVGTIAKRYGGGGHRHAAGFHARAGGAEIGVVHEETLIAGPRPRAAG